METFQSGLRSAQLGNVIGLSSHCISEAGIKMHRQKGMPGLPCRDLAPDA